MGCGGPLSSYSAPSLYQNGSQLIVIATGRGGLIDAFDGTTGATLWSTNAGLGTDATPTVDPANGRIYVAMGFDNIVIAGLDANGHPLWGTATKPVYTDSGGTDPQEAGSGALSFDGSTYYFQTLSSLGKGMLYAINTADRRREVVVRHAEQGSGERKPVSHRSSRKTASSSSATTTTARTTRSRTTELGTLIATIQTQPDTAPPRPGLGDDFPRRHALPADAGPGTGGVPTQPPTGTVQNLYCAIDMTANPVTTPKCRYPRGIAAGTGGKMAVVELNADCVTIYDSTGTRTNSFGCPGSGNGQLNSPPTWPSIPPATSVVDTGNNRVEKFSSTGTYLSSFGSAGTAAGQFNAPQGIFIDSGGRIYVADTGNQRVERFTTAGAPRSTQPGAAGASWARPEP